MHCLYTNIYIGELNFGDGPAILCAMSIEWIETLARQFLYSFSLVLI